MPELNEEYLRQAVKKVKPEAITKKQFEDAYDQVIAEMMNDDKLQGINKLLIPLTGSVFADKMKIILFDKKEEN